MVSSNIKLYYMCAAHLPTCIPVSVHCIPVSVHCIPVSVHCIPAYILLSIYAHPSVSFASISLFIRLTVKIHCLGFCLIVRISGKKIVRMHARLFTALSSLHVRLSTNLSSLHAHLTTTFSVFLLPLLA